MSGDKASESRVPYGFVWNPRARLDFLGLKSVQLAYLLVTRASRSWFNCCALGCFSCDWAIVVSVYFLEIGAPLPGIVLGDDTADLFVKLARLSEGDIMFGLLISLFYLSGFVG